MENKKLIEKNTKKILYLISKIFFDAPKIQFPKTFFDVPENKRINFWVFFFRINFWSAN